MKMFKMGIIMIIKCILSVPKSIFFNFKYLPLKQAVHLPILISYNVVIKQMRGGVFLNADIVTTGMIHIGINNGSFDLGRRNKTILQLQNTSELIFDGKAAIAGGAVINNSGIIEFGKNFSANFGLFISCNKKVYFGDECLLGWNNTFIDNDGHRITNLNEIRKNYSKEITIGEHNWITSEVTIMKGGKTGKNCVIGYNAFIREDFSENDNVLIVGQPARIVKKNINWEK